MNISRIKKIAFLARLKIDDNKVEPLRDELNSIFDWIKLLEEVAVREGLRVILEGQI